MKGIRAAKRYAKSFMQLAIEKSVLDEVLLDIKMIHKLIADSKELKNMLQSPLVNSDKKRSICKQLFDGKVNALTSNFIDLCVELKREAVLDIICEEIIAQYNDLKNIAKVNISTAVKMSESNKAKILESIKSAYQLETIELTETVDESLLGGMVMRIGDRQLDASIKRQLVDIEKELVKAN